MILPAIPTTFLTRPERTMYLSIFTLTKILVFFLTSMDVIIVYTMIDPYT